MALLAHQRSAPLDARERLASLARSRPDTLFVVTCHRFEAYFAVPAHGDPAAQAAALLDLAPGEVRRESLVCLTDAAAATHLFRVAAGLDAVIVGEPQILSQVRRAYTPLSSRWSLF